MLSVGHRAPSTAVNKPYRKIRIGMVLDQPFPPDARVEREAVALAEAGYEVHLLCAFRPADTEREEPSDDYYRGIYIHRVDPDTVSIPLPWLGIQSRFLYRGVVKNYFRHFKNIDTAWHTLIHRFIKQYDIQILHVHDLRLVDTGLSVTERYGLPLIADLHENYPALMQMMKGRNNPERGEKQFIRWDRLESNSVRQASQVITVAEEAKERLVKKGFPPEKIHVLENTVDMEKFLSAPVDQEIIRRFKPEFVLTYVGHLNDTHRGIQTVIEAMRILRDEIPELHFIAAGAVREPYRNLLVSLINDAGLVDRVHFTGWLDEAQFVTYIESSDICLCPHISNDQTNATFPNKVYLYHLFKKPIIVSDAIPLRRYVENTQGGLVYPSGDAQILARQIKKLYRSPELRKEAAMKGYKAVLERYNWQKTSKTLLSIYEHYALAGIQP